MRLMELKPVRPLSPALVKKEYESIEKKMDEDKNLFYFTIRAREDDHLIGKAVVEWIDWTNGNGWIRLGLGAAEDRRRGLGSQTLGLLLRYAFAELNLFRVSAMVPEYNEGMIALLKKFGFVEEVRRRQAVQRDGHTWDLLTFGQLRSEWEELAVNGRGG
jgi:RimJ/RimL family protein N-acetyltransferase